MKRDHVQLALVGAASVLPGGGRNSRQIRIVLHGVGGQIRRQVRGLSLQKLLAAGHERDGGGAGRDRDEGHDVGQVVASHDCGELGRVVRHRGDGVLHIGVERLVDRLPGWILFVDGRQRQRGFGEDIDRSARSRRCRRHRRRRIRRIAHEPIAVHRVASRKVRFGSVRRSHVGRQHARVRGGTRCGRRARCPFRERGRARLEQGRAREHAADLDQLAAIHAHTSSATRWMTSSLPHCWSSVSAEPKPHRGQTASCSSRR